MRILGSGRQPAGTLSLAILSLAACMLTLSACTVEGPGSADPGETSSSGARSEDPSLPTPPTSARPKGVTPCSRLLENEWSPPPSEPQVAYDPETGVATLYFNRRQLRLDLKNDAECFDLPAYGPILKTTLKQSERYDN